MRTKDLDAALHALGDPTRRAILKRLAGSQARVTELAAPFKISLNSVSKHIRILERAKLVKRRKSGREHFLQFQPAPLEAIVEWITQQQAFWKAGLAALDEALELQEKTKENRGEQQ